MKQRKISKEIQIIIDSINNKRAKIVIEHIIKHGFITTEDLEKKYGYNHPPRAARDVREAGIPLETFRVKSSDGRSIAAYKFGDFSKIQKDKLGGRTIFSKEFKEQLYEKFNGKCSICSTHFKKRYFQIDHGVPYEISGDNNAIIKNLDEYLLLCASCNRAKSWSCEHCANWQKDKSSEICIKWYWGNPADYYHVALNEIRRLDIVWRGKEVEQYEKLKQLAKENKETVPDFVKKVIKNGIRCD